MTTRLSSQAAEATWYVIHQDRTMEELVCKRGSGRLPEGSTGQWYCVSSSSSGGIPSSSSDVVQPLDPGQIILTANYTPRHLTLRTSIWKRATQPSCRAPTGSRGGWILTFL